MVQADAQAVDAFLEEVVRLEGVAQAGDGGVDVRHPRQTRRHTAVDDGLDGGGEEQVRLFLPEQAVQGVHGGHVAQGIEALAVQGIMAQAHGRAFPEGGIFFADGADGGLGSVVARGHGAKDLMPGGTHAAHEDGPEIGSGTGLIAQDEYFHGISFAHLSGGYAP